MLHEKERRRKGKERKGKERKGKERKGKERKGKERKGKEKQIITTNKYRMAQHFKTNGTRLLSSIKSN